MAGLGSQVQVQVTPLSGHRGRVTGLVVDKTGSRLISGGLDGLIKIWDLSTHQCLHTLRGHRQGINTLSYVPGLLVSGGQDGLITLWDPETGQRLKTLDLEVGGIHRLVVCQDRQRLVMAGAHPTLLMVDLDQGDAYRALKGHQGDVHALALSQGGSWLASGGDDSAVLIWDLLTGQQAHRIPAGMIILDLSFGPDGETVVAGGDDYALKLWDWRREMLLEICLDHNNWIRAVTFSPDGQWLISAADDYTINLRHLPTGQRIGSLRDSLARPCAVACHPNGTTLISGNVNGDIAIWSWQTTGGNFFCNHWH